jgi:formylglycine-generating enzyme required for sulfatase activity
MFPQGNTDSQISDLAGNVWEWCRNEYHNSKNVEPGGDGARVLRGGSWDDYQDYARSEYRSFSQPRNRNNGIGFRVVVSSPIQKS